MNKTEAILLKRYLERYIEADNGFIEYAKAIKQDINNQIRFGLIKD